MEAVSQGTLCIGLRSKQSAVLVALKKNPSKLACYQEKLFQVNDRIAVGVSGLTADARVLVKFMRKKDIKHRLKYGQEMPVESLVGKVSAKFRERTYISGRRPFGVGILVVGKDSKNKFRVYEFSPDGKVIEFFA